MKRVLLLFFLFFGAKCALAQQPRNTFVATTTVAGLPAAVASVRQPWFVSDGASSTDCTVGGGTAVVQCVSNGSAWAVSTVQAFSGGIVANSVSFQSGVPEYTVLCTHNLAADTTAFWTAYENAYAITNPSVGYRGPIAVRPGVNPAICLIDGSVRDIGAEFSGGMMLFYADVQWETRGLKIKSDGASQAPVNWTIKGMSSPAVQASFTASGSLVQFLADGDFPSIEVDTNGLEVSGFQISNIAYSSGTGTSGGPSADLYMHGVGLNHWKITNSKFVKQSGTAPLWIDGADLTQSYDGTLDTVSTTTINGSKQFYIANFTDLQWNGQTWMQVGQSNPTNNGSGQPASEFHNTVNVDMRKANITTETCGGFFLDGADTYSAGTTYAKGVRVRYLSVNYDSIAAGNIGHTPTGAIGDAYWAKAYGYVFELTGANFILAGRIGAADGVTNCWAFQGDSAGNDVIDTSSGSINGGEMWGWFSPYGTQQIGANRTISQTYSQLSYTNIDPSYRSFDFPYTPSYAPLVDDVRRMGSSSIPRYVNSVANDTYIGNLSVAGIVSAVGVTDEYGGTQAFTISGSGQKSVYHHGSGGISSGSIIEAVAAVRPHTTINGTSFLIGAGDNTGDWKITNGQSFCSQLTLETVLQTTADANGWFWCRVLAKATTSSGFDVYLVTDGTQDFDIAHPTVRLIASGAESDQDAIKETIALTPYSPLCAVNEACTVHGPFQGTNGSLIADIGGFRETLTHANTADRTANFPDVNINVASDRLEYCGATSGGTQACAKTIQNNGFIVYGDVALNTASSQSITTLPFSGTAYTCTGSDLTTAAGVVSFNTYMSASVTIVETGGMNTDHLRYMCVGN